MALQGSILTDHVPVNSFRITITGVGASGQTFFFSDLSGIETEVEAIDLPDRTKASGGQTLPSEFTGKTPLHHAVERAALNTWFKEGQDPVKSTYKKTATLIHKTISGSKQGKYTIRGLWITKRKLPDLDTTNAGDIALIEWTFSLDKATEFE